MADCRLRKSFLLFYLHPRVKRKDPKNGYFQHSLHKIYFSTFKLVGRILIRNLVSPGCWLFFKIQTRETVDPSHMYHSRFSVCKSLSSIYSSLIPPKNNYLIHGKNLISTPKPFFFAFFAASAMANSIAIATDKQIH